MAQKTVLIIDDEPDLVEISTAHLEEAGYRVISASNGIEGLELAKKAKPDLILLDIVMPGMDGLEMLETLRGTPGLAATKVLMLTAKGRSENIFEADRLRAVDYLIKPYSYEELVIAVKKAI